MDKAIFVRNFSKKVPIKFCIYNSYLKRSHHKAYILCASKFYYCRACNFRNLNE